MPAALRHMELYMANNWIIDVLADLKTYAELNDMQETALALEDAALTALAEISSTEVVSSARMGLMAAGDERQTGNVTQLFAAR
ncbi:MAG: hypothetical protein CR993_06795 [Rhodobacterales bacterium]|nr:MAG: hypothetical protein CR993_06795 [Rhodobacterales bacterium]